MMNLADVAVFVEAVRTGSLAAAARRLELAPMVASRRLAALEQDLGVRLLHRTTRALSLTAEGDAFLSHAQALLEEAENGRAAIRPDQGGATGLLRLTASVPFGRKVITAMLPAFLRANPQVRVDLLLNDSVVDIVSLGIDLAIRIAPMRDSTLVARRLADSPRGLYAAPAYLAARGHPRCLGDLGDHECLTITGTTHWGFHAESGLVRQRVAGRFSANSVDALHRACLDGLGIVTMAGWNVRDDVDSGRLVALTLADATPETLSIWAVSPSARMVPPKVQHFIRALRRHLDPR